MPARENFGQRHKRRKQRDTVSADQQACVTKRTRSLFCSHFGFAAERERGPIVAVPNLQTHAHTHTHSAATMSRKIWGLLQDEVSLSELLPHLAVVRACWSAIATILLWSGLAGQLLPPSCCGQGWLVSYCHYLAAAKPGLPPTSHPNWKHYPGPRT